MIIERLKFGDKYMKLQINESQNIEFKQSWRDEYIKWLSAFQGKFASQPLFATFGNTDGGKLYIGVDDDGEIKGIDNAKKHTSEPHNPLVAYPFFLAGYIESWGRGIEKIIEESQKFNGITPQFRWENGLWVEFYFNTDKSLPNGLGDKLGEKLGETQQNIIKLMQNNPKIAITALATELGISTTAIEKHIKTLKEQNIIQRIGGAKGGHWEILK